VFVLLYSQLSGIGASGSFQLAEPFTPSPAVLQGKDVEDETDDEKTDSDESEVDLGQYVDAYVPRPTKHGHGRKSAVAIQRFDPSIPSPKPQKLVSGIKRNKPASAKKASLADDRKNNQYAKNRRQSSHSAKASPPKKKVKKEFIEDESESDSEQSDDDSDGESEVYTPRKTKSRGGQSAKASPRMKKVHKELIKDVSESESEQSDDSDSEVYTPRKTKSRGGLLLSSAKRRIEKKNVDKRDRFGGSAAKSSSAHKKSGPRVTQLMTKVAVDRRQTPAAKKPAKSVKSKVGRKPAVKRLNGIKKARVSSRIATAKKQQR
jgi:hypothetical protein